MMYNKQMFAAAHVTMPANPTWTQIATLAAKLNNPSKGVAGICLRGLTGWGDNLASLDTVVNTFGGQWFDTQLERASSPRPRSSRPPTSTSTWSRRTARRVRATTASTSA